MKHIGSVMLLVVAALAGVSAQNWTQWRGPNRDGHTTAVAPVKLAQRPTTTWTVPVGIGHASPLVDGDRVYVFARRGEQEVVQALELATGKTIWTQQYDAPYRMNPAAASHGKGPKSTPVLAEGRLCTFGISGVLSCFDAATGKPLWRRSFEKEFPAPITFGTAMSPIVVGGLLVAHVGGEGRGALRAFDHATGTPRWSWTGEGPAYASPVLLTVSGSRQIVTQSQMAVVAVDAATGAHLWAIPFETPYEQNSVTPLVVGDLVVLSGLDQSTFAVRPAKTGSAWTAERVWENRSLPMYMSSPVLVGNIIVGFTHRNRGQFFAIDAKTGTTRWTSPPRQGENAALVASGTRVLALTNGGELIVFSADAAGFEAPARLEVATSPTWAHPVLLGSRLLVKDEESLALLRIG